MGRLFAPKPPKAEEAPPVLAPPPSSLSKDEIKELVGGAVAGVAAQLTQTVDRLGQKVEELATRQPQVIVQQPGVPQRQAEEITDADIDSVVLTGQGAGARIRAMVDRAVNIATSRVIEQHVKPLQDYGVNTIGELSRRITMGGMKHYDRYKKEIDERLNTLTPDVRANPVVIETIYNAVVGMHSDELAREAAEAAVRQAQEQVNNPPTLDPPKRAAGNRPTTPGSGAPRGGNDEDRSQVPDLDHYLGNNLEAGLEALQHKGRGGQTQDELARGMGYKDWSDYMKQYQELLDAETRGNA